MQLLLKLSFSVAVVLLVSWVYKFYSSGEKKSSCCSNKKKATCKKCNAKLALPKDDTEEADKKSSPSNTETHVCFMERQTGASLCDTANGKDAFSTAHSDRGNRVEEEILQKQPTVSTSNISSGSALKPPHPTECGMAIPTGRLSPCFLQKLEGSVGVGRELRQDLERQGAYSSFLSKAEIKVEDANLVLEGTGDQIVRGKIYDYYVQSSSHSITESSTVLGHIDRNSKFKPVEAVSMNSSLAESPSSMNTIIMRDLFLPQSNIQTPSPLENLKQRHPSRPTLLRKESYLSAAEQSELTTALLSSRALTPVTDSEPCTSGPVHPMICPSMEKTNLNVEEGSVLVTRTSELSSLGSLDSTDLECLKSKLDLGNSLETLYFAKKHGQTLVQQAALGVMSDNYLQVLRDPNLYGRLMADEREQIRKQRIKGRKFVMVADMDPIDWARNTDGSTSSAVYCYDDYKDTWHRLCLIPHEVISKACAMCTLDNYLYVAVGCQGTNREMTLSKRVFCYNPLTSIWKEISPMNEARPRCKLAALDGFIYAIGGECLSSVERYNPRLDRWTFVAPLPNDTFAVAHHVTVCNGEIFVSGGTLRCMLLRYNPQTNTWRPSLLGIKDRTADMVAVGRFLYRFDVNPLLGLSVYRYHTVARLWYECSTKRLLRCPAFQCVAMDESIYCVNRQFTMRFDADEVSPGFADGDLSVLSAAKGMLFPFVLSLPNMNPQQTSV